MHEGGAVRGDDAAANGGGADHLDPPIPPGVPVAPERFRHWRAQALQRWSLELTGSLPGSTSGWILTARRAAGGSASARPPDAGPTGGSDDLILKIAWAHAESRDEAAGLRAWSGCGGVEVIDAVRDGDLSIILMRRVRPGTTLAASALSRDEEDVVLAGLLRRLWEAPGAVRLAEAVAGGSAGAAGAAGAAEAAGERVRPLADLCEFWADGAQRTLAADPHGLPPAVIDRGLDLLRALSRPVGPLGWSGAPRLLATDLHRFNVLAAREDPGLAPEDWRVIDPKPYAGDPHYDLTQHMLNYPERLRRDPARFAARITTLTGLDAHRAQAWLFARCVQEAPEFDGAAEGALRLAERLPLTPIPRSAG